MVKEPFTGGVEQLADTRAVVVQINQISTNTATCQEKGRQRLALLCKAHV